MANGAEAARIAIIIIKLLFSLFVYVKLLYVIVVALFSKKEGMNEFKERIAKWRIKEMNGKGSLPKDGVVRLQLEEAAQRTMKLTISIKKCFVIEVVSIII